MRLSGRSCGHHGASNFGICASIDACAKRDQTAGIADFVIMSGRKMTRIPVQIEGSAHRVTIIVEAPERPGRAFHHRLGNWVTGNASDRFGGLVRGNDHRTRAPNAPFRGIKAGIRRQPCASSMVGRGGSELPQMRRSPDRCCSKFGRTLRGDGFAFHAILVIRKRGDARSSIPFP